jgi:5-formyltetrahydrofolate cyclo-ligase
VKKELRSRIQVLLAALPADDIRAKSRLACSRLIEQEEYRRARTVMLFLPMSAEADTGPIAQAAWRDGKTVLGPHIDWASRTILATEIASLSEGVDTSRLGVPNPKLGRTWRPADIDLIVAPALAIDRRGNRLGRGGGYYDRFLAQEGLRAVACALVFAEQLLDELPHLPHDRSVDMVVTDREVLRFGEHAGRRKSK